MPVADVFSLMPLRLATCRNAPKFRALLAFGSGLLLAQGCTLMGGPTETPQPPAAIKRPSATELKLPQTGEASWYGAAHQGKTTASGEKFDPARFTAAHRTLPFGTKVKVTNLENGKTAEVVINDRGPYSGKRIVDLSHAAAAALGMQESGTTGVRLEAAEP